MSLSDFVDRGDIKPLIDDEFPNAGERVEEPVRVSWQTSNYYLVGRAFNYVLGAHLEREADVSRVRQWGPREGVEKIREDYPEHTDASVTALKSAIEQRETYLDGGQLSSEFITAMFDLARLEGVARDALDPVGFGSAADDDVIDCIRLLKTASESGFDDVNTAIIRPSFGLASRLVGGAEADFIIDNTLISTKVTKQPTFKVGYWRRLVCYLTLVDLHSKLVQLGTYESPKATPNGGSPPSTTVADFGVYFARHGVLKTIDANKVYENPAYPEFRRSLVEVGLRNTADWNDDDLDAALRKAAEIAK